ncbi:MAG: M28 family peptidase [Acidobacteria bacterium]|nr:M28 family peptidase [Acidobacteriota bacterium]
MQHQPGHGRRVAESQSGSFLSDEDNRERIHRSGTRFPYSYPRRIVAPFGADEPFIYSIETHYGASDHEVFNDWGVQVPGVMMIAWPDQWYHTSGDRVNKADPTQLKRVAVIGAAAGLGVEPVEIVWSEEELDAQKIIPVPTSQVREKGYRGYREYLDAVPEDVQKKYAYRRGNIAGTSELQCLINGKNSILDIKLLLDSQFEKESVLKDILHYMELLKAAGLITYK